MMIFLEDHAQNCTEIGCSMGTMIIRTSPLKPRNNFVEGHVASCIGLSQIKNLFIYEFLNQSTTFLCFDLKHLHFSLLLKHGLHSAFSFECTPAQVLGKKFSSAMK